ATIAARFGITSGPEDRTLWYVKGGAAWVKDNFDTAESAQLQSCSTGDPTEIACAPVLRFNGSPGSFNESRWGWMVGVGVELGLIANWSAKIEYEFLDFGNATLTEHVHGEDCKGAVCFPGPSFDRSFTLNQQIHVIKVGLNYRFWSWGY